MTTRIHHLSCATMHPFAGRVGLVPRDWVAHCLVVETGGQVVLVDTGFGTDDVREGGRRIGRLAPTLLGFDLREQDTALAQLPGLGIDPGAVTDVVVTHLDLDHAGGLADFPGARVHVHRTELAAATRPRLDERLRYVAAQWAHGPRWVEHDEGGEDWFGFTGVSVVGDDVLLVPLPGHSRGHSAVAVRQPGGQGWLLHAGDAYFFRGDKETPRDCPPVLRFFQKGLAADDRRRHDNLVRLQSLHAEHGDEVRVFCAHDKEEYDALRG
jgi:glyoxylase-like metal-dependent hydrolase (beta-lactamase superfamily II)